MSLLFYSNRPHFLHPGRSAFVIAQWRRSIHLYYATKSRNPLGNHAIKDYITANFLSQFRQRRLELWSDKPRKIIDANIKLKDVIAKYIKPGICLIPLHDNIKNAPANTTQIPQYKLSSFKVDARRPNKYDSKKRAASEFHFAPKAGPLYFKSRMQLAFADIKNRTIPVELHAHKSETRKLRKEQRESLKKDGTKHDLGLLLKLLDENLHFLPDVIIKAMPKLTGIVVRPQTDFQQLCWVMGPPRPPWRNRGFQYPEDRTSRLYLKQQVHFALDMYGIGQASKGQKYLETKEKKIAVVDSPAADPVPSSLPTIRRIFLPPATDLEKEYVRNQIRRYRRQMNIV